MILNFNICGLKSLFFVNRLQTTFFVLRFIIALLLLSFDITIRLLFFRFRVPDAFPIVQLVGEIGNIR